MPTLPSPQRLTAAQVRELRRPHELPDAFPALWSSGSLAGLAGPCIAIVGTRAATAYGRRIAKEIARDLASVGCCVISGLALGIDAAAHEGALEGAGSTIGVLGGGHSHFFPPRNYALAERMIANGGAVVSPYAPDVVPKPWQFLKRNAVVAALANALVVVEAPKRSGALNTASAASERIDVFVVPGDVDRPHFAGSHALIREGATLVRSADDVLQGLPFDLPRIQAACARAASDDPLQQSLLDLLAEGDATLDALVGALDRPPAAILAALSLLELNGAVRSSAGRYGAAR